MKPTNVELKKIRIDGGTQQRPLDQDALERYEEMLRDGMEPPPSQVVFDGSAYWLWDGFHRYHVARKVGRSDLSCTVTTGTRRDAQFLSFGANKDHGVPRPRGCVAEIIRKMLLDKEWSALSQGVIAKHVGVSSQYVSKVKATINQVDSGRASKMVTGRDGRTINTANIGKAAGAKLESPAPPDPDDVPLDLPDAPKSAAPASGGAPAAEVVTDQVGRPVEGKVAEAFRRRHEMQALVLAVMKVRSAILKAVEAKDPLYTDILPTQFQADCNNVIRQLKAAMPHAACPYCRAAGCKACHGRGWIGELAWKAAPRELKQ
jgi:hypothetical protein